MQVSNAIGLQTVASSAAPTPTPSTTPAAPTPTVDYNQFLQLLITEMKNQDPTSPMDPTQTVSQLATFSTVEQAVQTNSKLGALLTSSALSQADSVIGRTVTSADGTVSGQIVSVQVAASGITAFLKNGQSVALGNGVTIS
jgi:flagellar basal-body rod modification protein FlgD